MWKSSYTTTRWKINLFLWYGRNSPTLSCWRQLRLRWRISLHIYSIQSCRQLHSRSLHETRFGQWFPPSITQVSFFFLHNSSIFLLTAFGKVHSSISSSLKKKNDLDTISTMLQKYYSIARFFCEYNDGSCNSVIQCQYIASLLVHQLACIHFRFKMNRRICCMFLNISMIYQMYVFKEAISSSGCAIIEWPLSDAPSLWKSSSFSLHEWMFVWPNIFFYFHFIRNIFVVTFRTEHILNYCNYFHLCFLHLFIFLSFNRMANYKLARLTLTIQVHQSLNWKICAPKKIVGGQVETLNKLVPNYIRSDELIIHSYILVICCGREI